MDMSREQLKKKYESMPAADLQGLLDGGGLITEAEQVILEVLRDPKGQPVHEQRVTAKSAKGSPECLASVKRYRDAYFVSRAISGAGSVIKVLGVFLGLLIIIGTLFLSKELHMGLAPVVGSAVLGVAMGTILYFVGILVSAQAQILKATLDMAVHTSPFLTDAARAEAMSLT